MFVINVEQAETYLEATRVEKAKQAYSAMEAAEASRRVTEEIARDPDPYGRLAGSIAPEIFGHVCYT
jgi:DNA replicative helicase MCM subunit Mcm2 (Cdc46/Mcm family)